MKPKSATRLTLVTPNRLDSSTRESLRFALRNPNLSILQLGEERAGINPIRAMVGRFDRGLVRHKLLDTDDATSICWVEREDLIDVSLIKDLLRWSSANGQNEKPQGLMITRELLVNGETWREQVVPRVWNEAAQIHLMSGGLWHEIDWLYEPKIRVCTHLDSEQITYDQPPQSFESDDDYLETVIFYLLIGEYETVIQLTEYAEGTEMRPSTWCSVQTARADALRQMGRLEEAAGLSLSLTKSYEDYSQLWFVYGCCALELSKFVGATGAFNRAQKSSNRIYHELYHESSVWEWQSLLGTLFARLGLGDTEGVKTRMKQVFDDVPEYLAKRLTVELTSALLEQDEVLLAWEIIEPRLNKDAVPMVSVVLHIAQYYVHQEGKAAALKWLAALSSNYGMLLTDFTFCQAIYELAEAVQDKKAIHEMLWILVEFEEAPESVYTALAKDLLDRGRLDEAERVEVRRQQTFEDE